MELKTYFAQDAAGNIISSAIVNVFLQGTSTLATGLTRADGTPLENPFAADGAGRIQFRAPDGYYDVQVSAGPGIIQTLTIQCVDYSEAKSAAEQAQNALNSITGINTNFEQNSREQWRRSLAEAGLTLVSGSFEEGATANSSTDAVWHIAGGQCYVWGGSFPKNVPENSTPESTGIVGAEWVSSQASLLINKMGLPTGSSLMGFEHQANTSASRTVQDKLRDFVALEDFGGKDDGGITDNSLAFQKAFAAGHRRIYLKGSGVYAMKTRDIELPEKYYITSASQSAEIKYLGTDSSFTMFTLTGAGPGSNQLKNGGMFENVVISSDVLINWIVGRHVQNLDFHKVFFYNAATLMNDYHYVYFTRCERWGSPFTGRSDLNTISYISESPKFNLCFSSNSPIDAWDTADVTVTSCTMFAGDYGVRTRNTLVTPTAPDLFAGYPVLLTGSVFDAIRGHAWDLEGSAYSTITGNLVSAGRETNVHGAYINGGRSLSLTGNVFTYCGNYGLALEDVQQSSFVGNVFNGNKTGGLGTIACKDLSIVGGSMGTTYVRGGYYTQPVGYSDISSNSTGILLSGVAFDEALTTKIYLDTNITTRNKVINCSGVPDTVARGSTANRPTTHEYGQPYFDTTLGKPVYWNSVTSSWTDAMGNNV